MQPQSYSTKITDNTPSLHAELQAEAAAAFKPWDSTLCRISFDGLADTGSRKFPVGGRAAGAPCMHGMV
jgi:hypothetical protein